MNRLETVLASLPQAIVWPEPSELLASRVRSAVEIKSRPRGRIRWVLAAAVVIALVVGLVPGTRQAVANLFREAGVRIGFVADTPGIDPGSLLLGDPVSLDEARSQADFTIGVPAALGDPDAVFVGEDRSVSLVWFDEAVVISQVETGPDYAQKGIGPETEVTSVRVGDTPALWVQGAPHTFTLLDPAGAPIEDTTRLAHNVLLWTRDGVGYRLESGETLDRALAIAETMEVD